MGCRPPDNSLIQPRFGCLPHSPPAASAATQHPDFSILAARIAVSNLHKQTCDVFSDTITLLRNYIHPKVHNSAVAANVVKKLKLNQSRCSCLILAPFLLFIVAPQPHNPHHQTGKPAPLIAEDVYAVIMANKERLNAAVKPEYDYDYDFFGFKTLERSYLLKLNGKIAERPCYMLMRVSVGLHKDDIDAAIETYTLMSQRYFTHASPTLFNSGTPKPQMSSCFLMQMAADSIEGTRHLPARLAASSHRSTLCSLLPGIYDTLKQCACISKYAGGIGLAIHKIRSTGSYIAGTNGE